MTGSVQTMRSFLLVPAASLLIGGCATPYVEPPASSPTAALKLTNQSSVRSVSMVTFADGRHCPVPDGHPNSPTYGHPKFPHPDTGAVRR
jgi:hypothetical protein